MRRKRRRTDASALVAVAARKRADPADSLFTMLGVLAEEAAGLRAQRQEFDIRGDRE
jgi:hypothetical protein